MDFELTQTYQSSATEVTQAYADPDLYPTLVGLPKLGGIDLLDHEVTDEQVQLRIRFAFIGDLPGPVTAVIDPAKLTWVQETDHDLATGTTDFRLVPDHYPDRLSASGSFQITDDGDGARRVLTGRLKVRAPLVAGRVEGAIVSGLQEYLTAEAPMVDAYISS